MFEGWASSGLYTMTNLMRFVTSITWSSVFTMMVAIPIVIFFLVEVTGGLDLILKMFFQNNKRWAVVNWQGGESLQDAGEFDKSMAKNGYKRIGEKIGHVTYVATDENGAIDHKVEVDEFSERVQQSGRPIRIRPVK